MRNTKQFQLPLEKPELKKNSYNIYPDFIIKDGLIYEGFSTFVKEIQESNFLIMDGFVGVIWEEIKKKFDSEFLLQNIDVEWVSVEKFLISEDRIAEKIFPFLGGDDPLFGRIIPHNLEDFFDVESIRKFKNQTFNKLTILYGSGASLGGKVGKTIYLDVPKNEIQYRSRAGSVCNLFQKLPDNPKKMYKQFFFVDWILLNKEKRRILNEIDYFIDAQHFETIVWMQGNHFRAALKEVSQNAFRVRPWFEPGPWGGQWIKEKINGLNPDVPNYAWSFELICPENGILLSSSNLLLEASFDFLMFSDFENILGKAAQRFQYDFPIRFDFLDTFDGGNLSVQCHPTTKYIQENFSEPFTQDESYYILDCEPEAKVYLGFQDDINKEEFKTELKKSETDCTPSEIEKFVQVHDAAKHDLFLIPAGTVHCSGINNLVLEISSTPYIYTFKMYDWLRLDLDGKPRTLNINRAFENLDFDRKGEKVKQEHLSKVSLLSEGMDWKLFQLSTHSAQFYAVKRFEFESNFTLETENNCFVMSLVEGESVEIETNERKYIVNYAETFIVPAATKIINFRNLNQKPAMIVMAYVKSEEC